MAFAFVRISVLEFFTQHDYGNFGCTSGTRRSRHVCSRFQGWFMIVLLCFYFISRSQPTIQLCFGIFVKPPHIH